jgi:uncharacterized protein YggE
MHLPPRPSPTDQTITVPGHGRVTIEPDLAEVRLGVSVSKPTAAEAREAGAAAMAAVLSAVEGAGVARSDVRTSQLSLSPEYDHSRGRPRLVGYALANLITVTVRDLTALGRVVDAALGAGATSLDSLAFRREDPTGAEAEARAAAVSDARARATTLAEAARVSLGKVVGVVEGPVGGPIPMPRFRLAEAQFAAATPVEAGTLDVEVSVVVSFAID